MSTLNMKSVKFRVSDISLVSSFYTNLVGLKELSRSNGEVVLGDSRGEVLVLSEDKDAKFSFRNETGLYHIALVFEKQSDLAGAIVDIFNANPQLYEGCSDHKVSEAFYFHDPDGNGVELYFDKPSADWEYDNFGNPVMGGDYIDINEYVNAHYEKSDRERLISLGHIHLKVADIEKAKKFYIEVLGFDLTFEMPTAIFVSKDKYHHHIGMNIWESRDAAPRDRTKLGVISYNIEVKDQNWITRIKKNLIDSGIKFEETKDKILVDDPWNNSLVFIF